VYKINPKDIYQDNQTYGSVFYFTFKQGYFTTVVVNVRISNLKSNLVWI